MIHFKENARFFLPFHKKSIRFEEGKPVREYFKSWKANFVQGSIATVIYLLLAGMFGCAMIVTGGGLTVIAVVFSGVILAASFLYFFPVLSRFTVTVKACFQISVFLAVHYIVKTGLLMITLGLCVTVFCMIPVTLPILIPLFTLYTTFFMERVFKEYMNLTEEDADRWYTKG